VADERFGRLNRVIVDTDDHHLVHVHGISPENRPRIGRDSKTDDASIYAMDGFSAMG
jgi:hypothetical protein